MKRKNFRKIQPKVIIPKKKKVSKAWPIYLIAILSAIFSYVNGLNGDFVHDDIPAIVKNSDVSGESGISDVFLNDFWGTRMSDSSSHKSYRPLTILTFRLNYSLHGPISWWFHMYNVILHACCCALVTRVCLEVARLKRPFATLGAVLFAVHPIHTEAVTGIVGRADVLACLFFLSSLLVYHNVRSRNKYVWLSIFLGGLSMLSKETGVTVLMLNLLFDIYRCWPSVKRSLKNMQWNKTSSNLSKRASKILLSLLVLILGRLALLQGSLPTFSQEDNPAAFNPYFSVRLMTFCYLAAFNWWLLLYPSSLSHDWQMGSIPLITSIYDMRNLCTIVAFGAVLFLTYKCLKDLKNHRNRPLVFGFLMLTTPFILASNIFITVGFVIAERVLYIPSIGSIILIVYGVQLLWRNYRIKLSLSICLLVLVISSVSKTYQRNKDWKNKQTLLRADLEVLPHNAKFHYNYANFFKDSSLNENAKKHYREALRLWPSYASAHNNLGTLILFEGKAEYHFLQAIHYAKDHVNAHFNLGKLYRINNHITGAQEMWERCITLQPKFIQAYTELMKITPLVKHARFYKQFIALEPNHWQRYYIYGKWFTERGLHKLALKYYKEAFKISIKNYIKDGRRNGDLQTFTNLALTLRSMGKQFRIFQMLTRWHTIIRPLVSHYYNNIYMREWQLKLEVSLRAMAYSKLSSRSKDSIRCFDYTQLELNLEEDTDAPNKYTKKSTKIVTTKYITATNKEKFTQRDCKKNKKFALSSIYKPKYNKSDPGHKHKNKKDKERMKKKNKKNSSYLSDSFIKTF